MYGERGGKGSVGCDECRCGIEWSQLNTNDEAPNVRNNRRGWTKSKDTNHRRRRRNLLHNSLPHLSSPLRRTAYFPLPVDTLKSSFSASLAGAHTVTLDFPTPAVLARLRNTATGDEARGRGTSLRNVGELLTLLLLVVVVAVTVWNGHGSGHRGGYGDGHGGGHGIDSLVVVEVVDLEMERVVDWHAHGWDWLGGHVMDRLWDGDGSDGDVLAVEL